MYMFYKFKEVTDTLYINTLALPVRSIQFIVYSIWFIIYIVCTRKKEYWGKKFKLLPDQNKLSFKLSFYLYTKCFFSPFIAVVFEKKPIL